MSKLDTLQASLERVLSAQLKSLVRERDRATWLDELTLSTVIVHTKAGPSLKGLKAAVHDDCIVLRDAFVLDDAPSLLNGDVVIPREQVLMLQLVAAHDDA